MATRNIYRYFGNYHLAIRGVMGEVRKLVGPYIATARGSLSLRKTRGDARVQTTRGRVSNGP